jgi:hypothetical protein
VSAPTETLAALRAAMADLAVARRRYETTLSVFNSAWRPYIESHDALGLAIEAAQEASSAAVAAAFEEKVS